MSIIRKTMYFVLAFTIITGFLSALAGCNEFIPSEKASDANYTDTETSGLETILESSISIIKETKEEGIPVLSDVIWLTGEPIGLDGTKIFYIEHRNGFNQLMDYNGNVLGEYGDID